MKLMDQCAHCIVRGNIKRCLAVDCCQHDNWMAHEIIKLLEEAATFFSIHNFDGEKEEWLKKAELFIQIKQLG
ncbi:hypothetical protein ACOHYD_13885 [Desulfobacterota bacterium M19]